jgi:hypothetical protein
MAHRHVKIYLILLVVFALIFFASFYALSTNTPVVQVGISPNLMNTGIMLLSFAAIVKLTYHIIVEKR